MRLARLLPLLTAAALMACQPAPEPAPPASETPVAAPVMPTDAPPLEPVDEAAPLPQPSPAQPPAADTPCRDQIGAAASARLVERCRMVSPATHPPCNAANPCALIQEHIDWACAKWGPGETKPAECAG